MIEKLQNWKLKNHRVPQDGTDGSDDEIDDDDDIDEIIGKAWWRGFCWCHKNQLSAKKAVHFDSFCGDWCMVCNFEQIYKKVYSCMVDCGIAVQWADGPKWYNYDGEVVDREEDAFGRKTSVELVHPENSLH